MSILKSLVVLQAAVDKAVRKSVAKEVESIISDGFVDWSNTTHLLGEVGLSDLLDAKAGGDLFSTPRQLHNMMTDLTYQMEMIQVGRKNDYSLYARITGQTLDSVLKHKADSSMRVVRAKDEDGYYVQPQLVELQKRRNAARDIYEDSRSKFAMFLGTINVLSAKEQQKLKPELEMVRLEIQDLKSNLNVCQNDVDEAVETYKAIEDTYGYTLNADGKRVYPKHEFNMKYSKLLASGRTTIASLRKYLDMFQIQQHIPTLHVDFKRAEKVFGL